MTTNGLLLTPAVLDELDGAYGQIRLSLYEDNDPFARTAMLARVPLQRLGTPEDIAHAVAYLASPGASYVTGVTLHVNGGMYMV